MELMEDGTTMERQMFAMAAEKKVPLYGVLELLPLCNLNCDMCYVRMSREEMEQVGRLCTIEEWTKVAEDMMKAGTLFVLLTGGEPLLYPNCIFRLISALFPEIQSTLFRYFRAGISA